MPDQTISGIEDLISELKPNLYAFSTSIGTLIAELNDNSFQEIVHFHYKATIACSHEDRIVLDTKVF
jgi:hypothetical protein